MSQSIVASVELFTASCIVIPAPFAEPEVSPEPLFRVIFLSSTSRVATFAVIVSPLTVKFPGTVKSPPDDSVNILLPLFAASIERVLLEFTLNLTTP